MTNLSNYFTSMNEKYLPFKTNLDSEYENLQNLFSVEGGTYFFTTKDEKYYVISDFGTMADFLDGDDKELEQLKTEHEFKSKKECLTFIKKLIKNTKNEKRNINIPKELL